MDGTERADLVGTADQAGTEGHPIEQIMVKRVGGWTMVSLDQWREMLAIEQKELVTEGRVRFVHQDSEVPIRDALLWLEARKRQR